MNLQRIATRYIIQQCCKTFLFIYWLIGFSSVRFIYLVTLACSKVSVNPLTKRYNWIRIDIIQHFIANSNIVSIRNICEGPYLTFQIFFVSRFCLHFWKLFNVFPSLKKLIYYLSFEPILLLFLLVHINLLWEWSF